MPYHTDKRALSRRFSRSDTGSSRTRKRRRLGRAKPRLPNVGARKPTRRPGIPRGHRGSIASPRVKTLYGVSATAIRSPRTMPLSGMSCWLGWSILLPYTNARNVRPLIATVRWVADFPRSKPSAIRTKKSPHPRRSRLSSKTSASKFGIRQRSLDALLSPRRSRSRFARIQFTASPWSH